MSTPAFIIEHPDRFPQSGSTQLSSTERRYAYLDAFDDRKLVERHLEYGELGKDLLCPPSPRPNEVPNTPSDFPERFRAVMQGVPNIKAAGCGWTQVRNVARLKCTRGLWTGFGARADKVEEDSEFEWFLAEDEEEYAAWEERRNEQKEGKAEKVASDLEKHISTQRDISLRDPKKLHEARSKVTRWQASLAPTPDEDAQASTSVQPKLSESQPLTAASSQQSRLSFTVKKSGMSAVAKGKQKASAPISSLPGSVESVDLPGLKQLPSAIPSGSQAQTPPQLLQSSAPAAPTAEVSLSSPPKDSAHTGSAPRISQLSDSFQPPSFDDVFTSTQQEPSRAQSLQKIPPIPQETAPVRLASPPPFPGTQQDEIVPSSSPPPSPPPVSRKRSRESSPLHGRGSDEELYAPSSPAKKPRVAEPAPAPIAQASSLPRMSTPPLSEAHTDSSSLPGLGNAAAVFPITPSRTGRIPASGERVLASSQRSRSRPRPPSRSASRAASRAPSQHEMGPPRTPDPGPTPKPFFSSPASSSSGSEDEPMPPPGLSPIADYTAHPSSFAPQFTSTQKGAGATGYGGLAYSSQYDVEHDVGNISHRLDQDVDFEQWLHDSPVPDE
ncbi:hypothetical protein PENSPDRAFT_754660 [Peniophora sp. CONT]|nr:hypothetical protein PENSPDRAFT_754660 [Peniophora sp. CONT]